MLLLYDSTPTSLIKMIVQSHYWHKLTSTEDFGFKSDWLLFEVFKCLQTGVQTNLGDVKFS